MYDYPPRLSTRSPRGRAAHVGDSIADVGRAPAFAIRVIAERLGRPPTIRVVSALERTRTGPTRDWVAMEDDLVALARKGGVDLVQGARRRGLARMTARLGREIAAHRQALERPIEESEGRLDRLAHAVGEAQGALRQLDYVFRAEEDSIRRVLDARRDAFLRGGLPAAAAESLARLQAAPATATPRTEAVTIAQAIAHERLEGWASALRPEVEALYRRVTETFVALANDFLRRVAEMRSRERALHAAYERTTPYLETNSARMTSDLATRVRESGARLRSELVAMPRALTAGAERAIERGRSARAAGEEGVLRDRERLAALEERLRRSAS